MGFLAPGASFFATFCSRWWVLGPFLVPPATSPFHIHKLAVPQGRNKPRKVAWGTDSSPQTLLFRLWLPAPFFTVQHRTRHSCLKIRVFISGASKKSTCLLFSPLRWGPELHKVQADHGYAIFQYRKDLFFTICTFSNTSQYLLCLLLLNAAVMPSNKNPL